MKKVSFVIPCYQSSATISGVIDEIQKAIKELNRYDFEVILVDDSSPDNTFEVIRSLCKKNKSIKGISLAKNFGQHSALMAGMCYCEGDYIVCLDDDGQTPPSEVGKLISKLEEGYDVVYARYDEKMHSFFRNIGSKINEIMTRYMLGKPKKLYISSYFATKKFVVENILKYKNSYPYVIGLILRTTNNISNVSITHCKRLQGKSGYTLRKLLGLWLNGFTAFSVKPLRVATVIGSACSAIGFIYGIYIIIKRLVNPDIVLGFASLMSATVFIGGILMMMLGLIGEYIGRIYISINAAPQYVIKESCGNYFEEIEKL